MEAGKKLAILILRGFDFHVDEIPVGDGRTADLRVTDDAATYHIEVKDKSVARELADERTDALMRGDLYEQSDLLAHQNTISGVLRDAARQLDQTPKTAEAFQLIWFHADGIDADAKYRQAFATFYGQVYVTATYPHRADPIGCFYFDYSASFEMPAVEALILTDRTSLQVCLNEFAIRANEFRSTQFFREFHKRDGIFDPVALQASGQIIACRATIPRKNDTDIAKALQKQTGILYTPIRLTRHSATAAVILRDGAVNQESHR